MSVSLAEARAELWRRGILHWKLYPVDQVPVYEFIRDCPNRTVVVNIARQFGKSFIILVYAIEFALKHPGCQIRFVSSSQKSLRKIIHPNMRTILEDCPAEMRPQWRGDDGYYSFHNGSELHMAGANDGHEDDSRGQRSHLNVVDEAGFVDRLEYLVKSILLPQTKTTRGRTIIISTPPETPAHDYVQFMAAAQQRGSYIERTTEDDKHTSDEERREMIEELGGPDSTAVQREMYCKVVVEETRAIIPEFIRPGVERMVVQPAPPLTWEQPTESLDPGFADFHGILYGYWNFRLAKAVIQGEDMLQRATTDRVAEAIRAKEATLWAGRRGSKEPARWSDTDLRLIADLCTLHKLAVSPTRKDELEAQVNAVRMAVKNGQIIVDPSCVNLIRQLRTGIWNKQRTEFERTKADGHFDLIAALIYFWRNVDRWTNPYPRLPEGVTEQTHWIRSRPDDKSPEAAAIGAAFRSRA